MEKAKRVVVTVDDAGLSDINKVKRSLTAKGLKVQQVMPITGVIAGSCAPGKVNSLRSVKGVHSVEDELTVQLPPSDSEVQ